MFKKKIKFLIAIWICIVLGFAVFFSSSTKQERASYETLMNASISLDGKKTSQIKQRRYGVTKHFLQTKGAERLQFFLRGTSSDLVCDQRASSAEMTERFSGMSCLMQEGLPYEFSGDVGDKKEQTVRKIDAETAIYHYHKQNLFAERVKIARYLSPGDKLSFTSEPSKILMNGTASQVECNFSDEAQPFKAQNFRATFQEAKKTP
jgi:hypothetical protein